MLLTRRSTYLISCAMAGSKTIGKEDNFWPLKSNKVEPPTITPEKYKEIMNRYKSKK